MAPTVKPSRRAIALTHDEGEALWVFGGLAMVKATGESTGGGVAAFELLAPQGTGSPLHIHRREDEWFYVTEGELIFWVGGKVTKAPGGTFVYGPRDIAHTFQVMSPLARFLLVAEPAGFEGFMRALAEPAKTRSIPPANLPMPSQERITAAAEKFGIEIIGPPGIPS